MSLTAYPVPGAQNGPAGFPENPDSGSSLNRYIQTALSGNEAVRSAFHEWQSELAGISASRGLPDPKISFGYFLENIETAVGPQEWKIGFDQMIPWPGKLKIQGDMLSYKTRAAHEKLRSTSAEIIYQVETVYLDALFLEQSIRITRENLNLIKQWEQVILTQYQTGSARHADLIKTQIEKLRLDDNLATLEAKRKPLVTRFRALLNTDTLTHIRTDQPLNDPVMKLDRETVLAAVLANNPELTARTFLNEAASKAVTRAKLNWLPDFGVGVDYISTGNKWMGGQPVPESGKDPLVVMGSVSVPLWGYKQAAQVRSARENQLGMESMVENTRNRLKAEFEQTWFMFEDAGRKWQLYQNKLLPKSLESLKTTEKAYISGNMEFISLVDAQRRNLDFTLAAEKAKVDFYKSVAMLNKLAGRTE